MNIDALADQEIALRVPCPPRDRRGCDQPAGQQCRNLHTGEALERLPAHAARLKAAGIAHAPIDPRDLRADPKESW